MAVAFAVASRPAPIGKDGSMYRTVTVDRLPTAGDVHLRIWLADVVFDYAAAAEAVYNLIRDWRQKHWYTIELIEDTVENCLLLPRLPCERLFLGHEERRTRGTIR
ncbi:hypothetical protein [Nocardia noduli]|uniref:hypothetical protein n=1 Tax=Nocardia noduli TaxID=2815722 RepID=UPI001C21D633|nr:hypothetical protein [Nocardia noduli]